MSSEPDISPTISGPDAPIVLSPTAKELVETWLAESYHSARSREAMRSAIAQWFAFRPDGAATPADVMAWKEWMRGRGLTARTTNNALTSFRGFAQWASERGALSMRDVAGLRRAARNVRVERIQAHKAPTREEFFAVLRMIDRRETVGLRDYAIVCLAGMTGLRLAEMRAADVGDLREERGRTVLYITGKGQVDKTPVPLPPRVQQAVGSYLKRRGAVTPEMPLFTASELRPKGGGRLSLRAMHASVWKRLRSAGVSDRKITPHSLRKFAITEAFRAGASQIELQGFARHADPKTTGIYIDDAARAERDVGAKLAQWLEKEWPDGV